MHICTIQHKENQAGDPRKIAELVEAEQQEQLTREFRALLVRTYSSGAEPIAIEYDLEKTGPAWKVFDIRVAGISLAATYRSAFAEEVRNHGIDGLISLLSSKNRAAVKPVSVKT